MRVLPAWLARVLAVIAILATLTACGDKTGIWDQSNWDDTTWAQ
jgi:hypothetical protein